MLFVDEFCGILVYIKFGADVTSQYEDEYGISPGIRYSDYQSVQNGMLYSQVYDILGPGTCVSSYSDSGSSSTTMTYVWCYTENGENFIITITFQDNVVVNKEHVWHSQS